MVASEGSTGLLKTSIGFVLGTEGGGGGLSLVVKKLIYFAHHNLSKGSCTMQFIQKDSYVTTV